MHRLIKVTSCELAITRKVFEYNENEGGLETHLQHYNKSITILIYVHNTKELLKNIYANSFKKELQRH